MPLSVCWQLKCDCLTVAEQWHEWRRVVLRRCERGACHLVCCMKTQIFLLSPYQSPSASKRLFIGVGRRYVVCPVAVFVNIEVDGMLHCDHGRRSVGGQGTYPLPTFWSGGDALCFAPYFFGSRLCVFQELLILTVTPCIGVHCSNFHEI